MSARRPVDFYSVGQFVSGPGWRHLRRTIDTFELMFVRRGVLPMRVGEQTLHIEPAKSHSCRRMWSMRRRHHHV